MEWFRLYSNIINDPKLLRVSRDIDVPFIEVLGVWIGLLAIANVSPDRGHLVLTRDHKPLTCDDLACALSHDADAVSALLDAFRAIGMIDGLKITAWDDRQFETSTERSRRFRAKKRDAEFPDADETNECNAPTLHGATPDVAMMQRHATARTEQNRTEQNRTEQSRTREVQRADVAKKDAAAAADDAAIPFSKNQDGAAEESNVPLLTLLTELTARYPTARDRRTSEEIMARGDWDRQLAIAAMRECHKRAVGQGTSPTSLNYYAPAILEALSAGSLECLKGGKNERYYGL